MQREVWEAWGEWEGYDTELEYWVAFETRHAEGTVRARLDTKFHDVSAMDNALDKWDAVGDWASRGLKDVGREVVVHYLRHQPSRVHVPEHYASLSISIWRIIGAAIQGFLGAALAVLVPVAIFDTLLGPALPD